MTPDAETPTHHFWPCRRATCCRFDYTESTFSPPADDTFFYIRYPKQDSVSSTTSSTTTASSSSQPISEIVGNKTGSDSSAALRDSKNLDYSKHPLPCQPFIPFTADKGNFFLFFVLCGWKKYCCKGDVMMTSCNRYEVDAVWPLRRLFFSVKPDSTGSRCRNAGLTHKTVLEVCAVY